MLLDPNVFVINRHACGVPMEVLAWSFSITRLVGTTQLTPIDE